LRGLIAAVEHPTPRSAAGRGRAGADLAPRPSFDAPRPNCNTDTILTEPGVRQHDATCG